MSTVATLSSPFPMTNGTDNIQTIPQGVESGGAIVPSNQCLCNCGMTASLNCGTIEADDYGGPFAFRDYWEWMDTTGGVEGTIGEGFYVASLSYTSPSEGCLPTVQIQVDTMGPSGFGQIIVITSGVGTFYEYEIVAGEVNFIYVADRPNVVVGGAAGTYGAVTVPQSTPVTWRVNG